VAQLVVRNLDPSIIQLLKQRAAARGHSAEEEHRQILHAALRSKGLANHLVSIPEVGDDQDFERQDDLPRTTDL